MRILTGDKHRMDFRCRLTNTKLTLFYRMPTTAERFGYENSQLQRKGKKIITRLGEIRRKFGLKILSGIGEEQFGKEVDGQLVPISSDPGSEHFDPMWKALIEAQAMDLVEALAMTVFEQSAMILPPQLVEEDGSDDEPDFDPDDDDVLEPPEEEAEDIAPLDAEGN